MGEEIKTQDLQEEEQTDKVELFHLLPGKPSYGSEYYFQHYLDSTSNISEQPVYFIEYPHHFRHNPIYSFELAFNYYIVNVLYKNNLKPSYFDRDIENWIDRVLRDGILNQLITNIKNTALENYDRELKIKEDELNKVNLILNQPVINTENTALENYIRELKTQEDKSKKVKLIKHEKVIRNSIDLAVAWLEDIDLETHYYIYQSPKMDTFLEKYLTKDNDGNDKQMYRQRLNLCKYCLGGFTEKDESKILVPVDQLHTYDKTNTKPNQARNDDVLQVKGCRSKYKNVFRNPLSELLLTAKEKMKILYVSLLDQEHFENYITTSKSFLDKTDSGFFEPAKKVLNKYLERRNEYNESLYLNSSLFVDVKKIVETIAEKFSNKISNCPFLFSNEIFDIYFDTEKNKMIQVPIPEKYKSIIEKYTKIVEFKGGGCKSSVNVLLVEKELPHLTPYEILDVIELEKKNERSLWYNS